MPFFVRLARLRQSLTSANCCCCMLLPNYVLVPEQSYLAAIAHKGRPQFNSWSQSESQSYSQLQLLLQLLLEHAQHAPHRGKRQCSGDIDPNEPCLTPKRLTNKNRDLRHLELTICKTTTDSEFQSDSESESELESESDSVAVEDCVSYFVK